MKKVFGFVMVGLVTLCLTGCGSSEQLKCTGNISGQDTTVKATLKDNNVTKVSMEMVTQASSQEEAKSGANYINSSLSSTDVEGMKLSAKANGKKVITTITMDISKMSASEIESEMGTADLTKDAFVKSMEEEGMTCR